MQPLLSPFARVAGQAAFIGVIGQFELMILAMLITAPLVLFLRKPLAAR